jgi:hypothetical protein
VIDTKESARDEAEPIITEALMLLSELELSAEDKLLSESKIGFPLLKTGFPRERVTK